jgi:hypothetical protein
VNAEKLDQAAKRPQGGKVNIGERLFGLSEAIFGFLALLLKRLLIISIRLAIAGVTAYSAVLLYPEGFFETPISALTPGDLIFFLLSIAVGILAAIFLLR